MKMELQTSKPQWGDRQQHLLPLMEAALAAVNPFHAVKQHLQLEDNHLTIGSKTFSLEGDFRIYVVGAGKAGVAMAKAVEQTLGDFIYKSLISVPDLPADPLSVIHLSQGGHPLPSEGSIQAGEKIKRLLEDVREEDLVLVLISGGGSALLEYPLEGLSLSDLQKVNDLLIKSGAPIQEINTVRRQLSMIKGGGLARLAGPATTVALILSDVVGDSLETIASGPTTPSTRDAKDVWDILKRYQLKSRLPKNVKNALEASDREKMKIPDLQTDKVINIIIGSNKMAAEAAIAEAKELGFEGILLTTRVEGEAREVGKFIGSLLKSVKLTESRSPFCIVLGGETTVMVRGSGLGGRNQELALAAALELEDTPNVAVMTLATDGIDGPTSSAGAIVDGDTISNARSLGLDAVSFLMNNDSHTFFKEIRATVTIGPTGTNVNDLIFCLIYCPW
jgi:glycerate 2-kinase